MAKTESEILQEIDKRYIKLVRDRKKIPYYHNLSKRRIHPAWKQVQGRIMELRRLRDWIRNKHQKGD